MSPATLSIIAAAFPPRQRGTAIGIWAGTSALALAIGPLAGGLITEHLSWHWIFFVNVPVGGVGLLAARLLVDESRDQTHERLDLPGLGTSSLGLFALTYGLIEANTYGWGSQRIVAAFAVATLSLAAFLWLERSQRAPLLHLELFRDRTFLGANLAVMLVTLSMFGVFFFVSLYLQNVRGFSAVQAGASFLPLTVLIVIVAPIAGRLADRVGSRWLMTTGMLCLSGHLVLLARLQADSSYLSILPAMIVGGLGMAVVMTPASAAAMKAVPVDKAGVGSGVLNTFRQVGGAVGIALMGAIVAAAGDGVGTSQAFLHGLHVALIVGALIALAGAAVAAWLVRAQHAPAGATSGSARAETA
jgi:EmrB/QacA subfamily drug resistance transporter